ncbi:G2/mitotic-specific cyclin-B isoform X2 [Copidosoma floridanum]|uniref:G2/mitotic-specific cyclin-B isoform X2 n=1 Tax=Copidosoma floridanum TaxID=29053 RepID=UPI0006C99CBE|nr:G2/mitotic-specific cyclin-B isoform X2 [Copidosoma floridanum]
MSKFFGVPSNQENTKNVKSVTTVPGQIRRAALGEIGNKVVIQRINELTGKCNLKDGKTLLKKPLVTRQISVKVEKTEKAEKSVPPKQVQVPAVKPTVKTGAHINNVHQPATGPTKAEIDTNDNKTEVIVSPSKKDTDISDPVLVEDIDEEDKNNPILVSIYSNDIYKHYRMLEEQFPIKKNFLQGQEVTPRMRCVLIDWLIEVHEQFHLMQETLYLTVAIIDRFLQVFKMITRKRLQLVGITAMFIASKYEEMYSPDISDFVYIADNTYTKGEILQMELIIIKSLDFSFGRPLPLHFLRRYSKAGKALPVHHTLAKYFLEQCLVHYEVCHYPPSLIAAAALYLSILMLGNDSSQENEVIWTKTLVHYSTYKLNDVLPVVSEIATLIINSEKSKFQAVRRKYSQPKHLAVSVRPELKSPTLIKLST